MLQPAPTYRQIRTRLDAMGYRFFTGAWNPNVMGIRCKARTAGQWDDLMVLAYEDDRGQGQVHLYPGTTDPGLPWLQGKGVTPHPQGTAILTPQQARGCWEVGPTQLHRNRYPCFKQVGPLEFVRDGDRDALLDIEQLIAEGKVEQGVRGFNGHRASAHAAVSSVGLYSAACQVWRMPGDFLHALDFVTWAAQWYGSRVTYTLLDQWLE